MGGSARCTWDEGEHKAHSLTACDVSDLNEPYSCCVSGSNVSGSTPVSNQAKPRVTRPWDDLECTGQQRCNWQERSQGERWLVCCKQNALHQPEYWATILTELVACGSNQTNCVPRLASLITDHPPANALCAFLASHGRCAQHTKLSCPTSTSICIPTA